MTYAITVKRESDGWWVVTSPDEELIGLATQGKSVSEAMEMAKEAIALLLDVAEDSFDIDPTFLLSLKERTSIVNAARRARRKARVQSEAANEQMQEAVEVARSEGLTVRDIGAMFDVSHQRVHQLLAGAS